MMLFLLWTVLIEPLPAANVELQLYSELDELPVHWQHALPSNFDFAREQLATRATFAQQVRLVASVKQARRREFLLLGPSRVAAPEVPRCPPCSGTQPKDDALRLEPRPNPQGTPVALYRVPRGVSRVFELYDERDLVAVSPCPPCRAP